MKLNSRKNHQFRGIFTDFHVIVHFSMTNVKAVNSSIMLVPSHLMLTAATRTSDTVKAKIHSS